MRLESLLKLYLAPDGKPEKINMPKESPKDKSTIVPVIDKTKPPYSTQLIDPQIEGNTEAWTNEI